MHLFTRLRCLAALVALIQSVPLAVAGEPAESPAARNDLVIATGLVGGLYFPVGGALCAEVNRTRKDPAPTCLVQPSDGPLANLGALRSGQVDLALVQSDWQANALAGEGRFAAAGPFSGLRAVMSLHGEVLTLLARPEAGVAAIADLKGRRVNLGPKGSVLRGLSDLLVQTALGPKPGLAQGKDLPPDAALEALCEGKLDAVFLVVGHPNAAVRDAVADCGAQPVPLDKELVARLGEGRPWLVPLRLPAGLYAGVEGEVPAVGLAATLVTRSDVAESAIHGLVKAVLGHFDAFRGQHPALAGLRREDLARLGRTAPLHPGAEQAYREAGLKP